MRKTVVNEFFMYSGCNGCPLSVEGDDDDDVDDDEDAPDERERQEGAEAAAVVEADHAVVQPAGLPATVPQRQVVQLDGEAVAAGVAVQAVQAGGQPTEQPQAARPGGQLTAAGVAAQRVRAAGQAAQQGQGVRLGGQPVSAGVARQAAGQAALQRQAAHASAAEVTGQGLQAAGHPAQQGQGARLGVQAAATGVIVHGQADGQAAAAAGSASTVETGLRQAPLAAQIAQGLPADLHQVGTVPADQEPQQDMLQVVEPSRKTMRWRRLRQRQREKRLRAAEQRQQQVALQAGGQGAQQNEAEQASAAGVTGQAAGQAAPQHQAAQASAAGVNGYGGQAAGLGVQAAAEGGSAPTMETGLRQALLAADLRQRPASQEPPHGMQQVVEPSRKTMRFQWLRQRQRERRRRAAEQRRQHAAFQVDRQGNEEPVAMDVDTERSDHGAGPQQQHQDAGGEEAYHDEDHVEAEPDHHVRLEHQPEQVPGEVDELQRPPSQQLFHEDFPETAAEVPVVEEPRQYEQPDLELQDRLQQQVQQRPGPLRRPRHGS